MKPNGFTRSGVKTRIEGGSFGEVKAAHLVEKIRHSDPMRWMTMNESPKKSTSWYFNV